MNMSDSFVIISGYTVNTDYEKAILNLEKSLKKFFLPYHFYPYKNTGNWTRNTMVKASLVSRALNTFDKDVIWLDADAIVSEKPKLFYSLKDIDCDLCCHFLKSRKNPRELLTGTIFFRNNPLVKSLVNDWENVQDLKWDQKILQSLIDNKYKNKLKIHPLPIEYIKIKPKNGTLKGKKFVIGHNQMSREQRNVIGN